MRFFGNHKDGMDTVIGRSARFEGDLCVKETVRIDGWFKGKIACDGSVILGAEARVEGMVSGEKVLIAGEVLGDVVARSHLQITGNGKVSGDVTTPSLVIDQGVVFEGKCHMAPSPDGIEGQRAQMLLASAKDGNC